MLSLFMRLSERVATVLSPKKKYTANSNGMTTRHLLMMVTRLALSFIYHTRMAICASKDILEPVIIMINVATPNIIYFLNSLFSSARK